MSSLFRDVVPDQTEAIVPVLLRWADGGKVDVILTTGGTGFGPRDVTPEATRAVLDRLAPGLPEAIRRAGEAKTAFLRSLQGPGRLPGAGVHREPPREPWGGPGRPGGSWAPGPAFGGPYEGCRHSPPAILICRRTKRHGTDFDPRPEGGRALSGTPSGRPGIGSSW